MFKCQTPEAFCQILAWHLESNHVLEAFKLHRKITSLSNSNEKCVISQYCITYIIYYYDCYFPLIFIFEVNWDSQFPLGPPPLQKKIS